MSSSNEEREMFTKGEMIGIVIVMVLWILFGPSVHAASSVEEGIILGPPVFDDEWDLSDPIDIPPPGPEICVDEYTGRAVLCREVFFGQVEI